MIRDLLLKLLVISAFMMAGMQTMRAQFIDTTETKVKPDTTLMRSSLGDSDDDYAVLPMSTTTKVFKTSFLHDDIDGTTVKQLIVLADPAPSYCAVDRKIRDARLKLRLKMGENDYEFAKNNDFIATVEVTAKAKFMTTLIETYVCTLEVSVLTPSLGPIQMKPEQLKVFDIIDDYENIEYFEITATFIGTPTLPTADLEDNLWLDAEYTEEFTINPKKLSDTTDPIVNVVPYGNVLSGSPMRFTWAVGTGGEGCTDNFPNYQLQILRLYNTNSAKTSETDIEAKVDWSEALTYEVGSSTKDITLTLAEGRGYYTWRVRPIGNIYPGEIANDLNWGVWSTSLPDNTSVVISATSKPELSSDIKPSVFFYNGFDEHMNWIYGRNFTEGSEATRIGEKMTYATSLLQAKQNQAKIQSKGDEFLIGQTVYDFSGRPTLVSLPAPVKQGGFEYNQSFVQHESAPSVLETYSALNFDYDADAASGGSRASNYKEPNSINYGAVHAYYSDLNQDIQIPNADGYGFSRTILYPDGTGRMQEQSGAGDVHRLKPATSLVDDRTIKSMYGGAPDAELIAMFGDEAPAASSVQKIFSVDPNKVISVKYISKEGQTLATCLVKNTPSGPSSDLLEDLDNEASFEELVRDTIWNEPRQRRFVLPVETTVTMRYSIWPNQIQAECGNFCKTCEYRVYFYIHDLQDKENTKLDSLIIDPKECWDIEDWPKQKVLEWTLPVGSYIAERRIVSDNPVDISKPLEIRYEDQHAKEVEEMVEFEMDYFLDPIRAFLDSNNIEGLYSYLSTAPDVTLVEDEYVLETECCTIRIPVKECGGLECPEDIEFEEMLYEKWGSEWGTTLDGYFWNVGGVPTYPATTPYTSNTGVFNDMIEHMIVDGYDCGELYAAWEVLVQTFGLLATTDGSGEIGMKNNEFDLLQTFLRSVGKQYESVATYPYGGNSSTKGYLEYAYRSFYYEAGVYESDECEERVNAIAFLTWGADPRNGPYADKQWEQLYDCLTGHKTTGIPTSEWMPSCEQKDTTCLKKYAEAVEDSCRSICWKRFPGFVESVKEAYRLEGKVIEGDKYLADGITLAGPLDIDISLHTVYCHAWSLVMHCESGCDLTIFRSDSAGIRKIDSIGSPAERDSLTKSMTYTYRVAIPDGENECPDSLYHVGSSSGSSYADFVVRMLNRKLKELRLDHGPNVDGEDACHEYSNLLTALLGSPRCSLVCEIGSRASKSGERSLQESEGPCSHSTPYLYELNEYVIEAEFIRTGPCKVSYRRLCGLGEFAEFDTLDICDSICGTGCMPTCFLWINPVVDPQVEIDVITCEEQASRVLRDIIEEQASGCTSAHGDDIRRQYRENCASPADFGDTLSIEYEVGLYHFTLYYYDRAGNTVRTVPPNGVDLSVRDRYTHPEHTFITLYHYNSLGQLIAQITPDGGRTDNWYNSKGQIRFSQNAEQLGSARPRFSYTKYDKLGRTVETGESLKPVVNDVVQSVNLNLTAESSTFPMMGRRERIFTVYSKPAAGYSGYLGDAERQPRYLQNRISYTHNDDGVATYYSYDPHGNVEWMEQWTPGLGGNYIGYKYDLISGNMLEVHYDSTVGDGYHHRYTYDADNRLVKVETSRDGSIWDRDASYTYYDYGPVRSIALGEDRLQQLDYTYTIQGWLKGINHPSLDPAKDPGRNGYGADRYAPDAFGMILGYYEGDFHRRYNSLQSVFNSSPTGSVYTQQQHDLQGGSLYNGNISSWTSNIIAAPSPPQPLEYEQLVGYTYRYDRLNRLLASDFRPYDLGLNEWPSVPSSEYATQTTYDPAGNIQTMNRTGYSSGGSHPLEMDEMTYVYESGKNQLLQVDDAVTGSNYEDDIDDQSADNYTYDAIGNLIRDNQEGVRIRWNVYGKIDEVWRQKPGVIPPINQRTYYSYNAAGNRVRKEFINYTHPGESKVTFYVRDANEQVIAIYEQSLQVPGEGGTDCILTLYQQAMTEPEQFKDTDLDWVPNDCDGCEETEDPWQEDYDGDGVGDICDNCPFVHNPRVGGVQPTCSGGGGGGGMNGPELWWQQGEDPIVQHGWNSPLEQSRGGWMNTWPSLAEFMLYGTNPQGRFGTVRSKELRDTTLWLTDQYTRQVDKKDYEVHDHLGNVRTVLSDMKLNGGTQSSPQFSANLKSYNNFYPSGMIEPDKTFSSDEYRYSFNGKEVDKEVNGNGNIYDYGFRVYNPRLARFLSMDPLTRSFPELTPYQFSSNTPIWAIDLDGLEATINCYTVINQEEGEVRFLRKIDNISERFDAKSSSGLTQYNNATSKPATHNDYTTEQYQYFDKDGKRLHLRRNEQGNLVAGENELIKIHRNQFGPLVHNDAYPGGNNPLTPDLDNDYRREPKSLADAAGLKHDKGYDKVLAKGLSGVFLNLSTFDADAELVKDCMRIQLMARLGYMDPWTGTAISEETLESSAQMILGFSLVTGGKGVVKTPGVALGYINKAVQDLRKEFKDFNNQLERDIRRALSLPE